MNLNYISNHYTVSYKVDKMRRKVFHHKVKIQIENKQGNGKGGIAILHTCII